MKINFVDYKITLVAHKQGVLGLQAFAFCIVTGRIFCIET